MDKEEQIHKRKRHWWIFWVSLPLILFFMASLIFLYLNAERIVSRTIKTAVHERSNGNYAINYKNIDLSFLRGSLTITGLELLPDSAKFKEEEYEEPLYSIGSERISVIGFNLWRYVVDNVIVLGDLIIEKPLIEVAGTESGQYAEQPDTDVILRNELSKYFDDLIIGEFRINHAVVDFPQSKGRKIFSGIGSISLVLTDVHLDEVTKSDTSSLFFSDESLIIFHDLKYHLDSIGHDLLIDQVNISASRELINIENLRLEPVFSDTLLNEYRLSIPGISLMKVNVENILEEGFLNADELLINNPRIAVHLLKSRGDKSKIFHPDSVLIELPEAFSFISVNRLSIQDGVFRYLEDRDSIKNFAEASSFTLLIDSIEFDSLIRLRQIEDKLLSASSFAGKDVIIDFGKLKHSINADLVSLSPAEKHFTSFNLAVTAEDLSGTYMNGKIKTLELYDLDYESLLKKENLLTSILNVDSADIDLTIQNTANKGDSRQIFQLPYFEMDTVVVTAGNLLIVHKQEGNQELSFSSEIELSVEGFKPDTTLHAGEQPFDLQMAVLSLKKISVKRNRGFHIFINGLDFNSANQMLTGNDFRQEMLKTAGNGPRLIEIERLRLDGINMSEFLEKSNGTMKGILIENPEIYFSTSGAGSPVKPGEIQQEIADNILSFLDRLTIDYVDMNKLGLHFGQSQALTAKTDITDIYIDLKGIDIQRKTIQKRQPLFADELLVEIRNFREFLKDGSAEISFNQLLLNSQKNLLDISDFKYIPISVKAEEKSGLEFLSSQIVLDNFNFNEYYFDNKLIAGNLSLYDPVFYYMASPVDQTSTKNESFSYPPIAEFIKMRGISFHKGRFSFGNGNDTIVFDYDLNISSLAIDTDKSFIPGEDSLPFKQFSLKLKNFSSFLSESSNVLNFDSLSYSTKTDELYASGINLYPQMNEPLEFLLQHDRKMAASVNIPALFVDAFDFNDLYLNKLIDLQLLEMDELNFKLYIRRIPGEEEIPEKNEYFPGFLSKMNLDLLRINDLDLNIYRFAGDSVINFVLNDVAGSLSNFEIEEESRFDDAIFNAGDLYLEKANYSFRTADSMYILTADNLALSTGKRTVTFDSFKLIPRYPKYEFSRKLGYQTDRAEVEGQKILLTGVDFRSFFDNSKLFADQVFLDDFSISLFRDKRVAFPAWHRSDMPQKMLRELSFPLDIRKVNLQDFRIRYSELAPGANDPGVVFFEKMHGFLSNVTNVPDSIAANPLMQLKLKGMMLNESQMNVLLNMDLNSPRDTFAFYGSLSSMHMPVLNSLTRNLFGVAIKQGTGRVDTVMIFGNEEYETGSLVFPYRKFRIQMVDLQTGQRGGIGDGIMTFLANNILLKSNNPRFGQQLRVGRVFYKRNPRKSIFNFLWKGIMSGVETTLGINMREQKKEIKAFKQQLEDQRQD